MMQNKKDKILKDWDKCNKIIHSIQNKREINAGLAIILLFMKMYPDMIFLSLQLQTNLKIKEFEIKSFPKAPKNLNIIKEARVNYK